MIFLRNPAEIRKAVRGLFRCKQLDVAVAFIGADWEEILADFEGELRVICWLSSTNTNPYAVDTLRKRPLTTVKQRSTMHCKVYLAPAIGAVVGSANLSKAALEESDTAGQDEAAIYILERSSWMTYRLGSELCGWTRQRRYPLGTPTYRQQRWLLKRPGPLARKVESSSGLLKKSNWSSRRYLKKSMRQSFDTRTKSDHLTCGGILPNL